MKTWLWIGGAVSAGMLLALPTRAANQEEIQKAIDKGVKYLQGFPHGRYNHLGAPALIGLTLLECAVPADDPVIRNAAGLVQKGSLKLTDTYSIALAIMFLDRLGEEGDSALIQSLAVRLLAGQNAQGGWGYQCPALGEDEIRRLTAGLEKRAELRGVRELPRSDPETPRPKPALPREIADQIKLIERHGLFPANRLDARNVHQGGAGDNSNTQFAILGLWVARRHGIPASKALGRVERRFRSSQNSNGGWGYVPGMSSTATMTCAGLLALAVSHGLANETALRTEAAQVPNKKKVSDPARDPAIRAGLLILSTALHKPGDQAAAVPGVIPRKFQNHVYYFFWSLERVAVAFDLQTIGKKDWYAWGSEILVASQGEDGAWEGDYGPQVDTCFALLFLRRANLARDLTASLRGKVKDPVEVALKNGGVGGEALTQPAPKDGFDILQKPVGGGPSPASTAPTALTKPSSEDGTSPAAQLGADLVKTPPDQQDKLLDQYKNGKGPQFTEALARAIPQLPKASQTKARDALAERLTRMTAATLRAKLRDDDPEIRFAAARACASKEDRSHVPDLISLLDDTEPRVIRAARAALKFLSDDQDFGPAPDATATERAKAMAQWREWWKANGVAMMRKAADRK